MHGLPTSAARGERHDVDHHARGSRDSLLLVESGGPYTGASFDDFLADALQLAKIGADVRLLLIADAVLAAVKGAAPAVDELCDAGARVSYDRSDALRRGLSVADISSKVAGTELESMALLFIDPGVKVVWH